ncbi:unnamed protein product [Arabidopsis thaliana]|uniref:(thale cress) hypothetical protein n=1 Tax=Arabidopsis thaliana TaxID=3702 RepID=A0A7G2EER4_ARATH|nr:unnamed protein product [Arabidopsis thaliana]
MTFHVTMLGPSCCEIQYVSSLDNQNNLESSIEFCEANGLDKRCGEMILIFEKGRSWTVDLKRKNSCPTTYIKRGWGSFCNANGFRAGSFFSFKLFQRGGTPGLRSSHREVEEEAITIEYLSTEPDRNQDERSSQIWKASSSPSQNRFMTVTLKPINHSQIVSI